MHVCRVCRVLVLGTAWLWPAAASAQAADPYLLQRLHTDLAAIIGMAPACNVAATIPRKARIFVIGSHHATKYGEPRLSRVLM
jgi:hypothetical protein